ncbi:MAG: family 1 encapsulin nanocompartment shell protein, partial [Sulfitobacter sp.]
MSEGVLTLSEASWGQIRQIVHDEALRARVAASFLPLFGPLPTDTQTVPKNTLDYVSLGAPVPGGATERMGVVDYETMRLATLSINVYVKNAQLADPELTSATIMFRRAADIMARVEDAIVVNGQEDVGKGPNNPAQSLAGVQPVFSVSGGGKYDGLIECGQSNLVKITGAVDGAKVFSAVVDAIQKLEGAGHVGPFACIMDDAFFSAVTKPIPNSMVLPRDSILPFLDGPLLRSSTMPKKSAVIVSLQGAPVELVVPSDISVKYLQTTMDSEHIFRVQQKFV